MRVFGAKGVMHYEIDAGLWDTPDTLHRGATLYIQRAGYGAREKLAVPQSDMFRAELEMFAQSCVTGLPNELDAANANAAVAVLQAALASIASGRSVRIADIVARGRGAHVA